MFLALAALLIGSNRPGDLIARDRYDVIEVAEYRDDFFGPRWQVIFYDFEGNALWGQDFAEFAIRPEVEWDGQRRQWVLSWYDRSKYQRPMHRRVTAGFLRLSWWAVGEPAAAMGLYDWQGYEEQGMGVYRRLRPAPPDYER